MSNYTTVDITPTPRILRILGEIPFQPWQCIAELIDNSIDSFIDAENQKINLDRETITVSWSRDSVPASQRTIEIKDTALGMTLDQLQNAVRAGYSSNDPVNNLGLFGMGFNIATARLGETTEVYTSRIGDNEWIGLRLDFDALIRTGSFKAPVLRRPKNEPNEHGTIIVVSKLKSGILYTLSNKESEIRRILQQVYSPLLNKKSISILVKGKRLVPQKHCVWDRSRFVIYNGSPVSAVIDIDKSFGSSFFDMEKNRYLTAEEVDTVNEQREEGIPVPENIVMREKRVHGWVGIQRYANPNDFGIDFIRNGRKILMSDKSLFYYENPWTNMMDLQYPVELGSTTGGRIVGELNVDFLIPTYQKNGFDTQDQSWLLLKDYLCGSGPYLPGQRRAAGFTDPISAPIPLLANAYRRCDPGTKWLAIPNALAKQFLTEFRNGKEEYQSDTLWYKAAQEEDQRRRTGGATTSVNQGSTPTDDISDYIPAEGDQDSGNEPSTTQPAASSEATPVSAPPTTNSIDELLNRARPVITLSGNYSFGTVSPFSVKAYELTSGEIIVNNESVPCRFSNVGIDCTYIYNPRHISLAQYPMTAKSSLLHYLAERIKARDGMRYTDIVDIYCNLAEAMMPESRINKAALQEKADGFFKELREHLSDALSGNKQAVVDCIFEARGDVEETLSALFEDVNLMIAFQNRQEDGYRAIERIPYKTVVRLVDKFPELIFDGKVFNTPYSLISLSDENATARIRAESKERIISFLKDALRITTATGSMNKNELSRAAISLDFLVEALV